MKNQAYLNFYLVDGRRIIWGVGPLNCRSKDTTRGDGRLITIAFLKSSAFQLYWVLSVKLSSQFVYAIKGIHPCLMFDIVREQNYIVTNIKFENIVYVIPETDNLLNKTFHIR